MRSIILSVTALFLSVSSFAQYATPPDYFREVGLHVGVAPFSKPGLTKYAGTKVNLPITYSANFYYNFTERFQAGLDLGMTRWEGSEELQHAGIFGAPSEVRKTTYLFADKAWNLTARANWVFPMYDDWRINRSNFYVGLAAGAVFTVNDGSVSYGALNDATGERNRYVSQYNYASGTGFVVGGQIGYNYYFSNHLGFNIEAAPRYTHVYTVDARYNRANSDFDLWSYPVTVGLKFRF